MKKNDKRKSFLYKLTDRHKELTETFRKWCINHTTVPNKQ